MTKLVLVLGLAAGLFIAMPAAPAEADLGAIPQLSIDADLAGSWVGWGDFWAWLRGAAQDIVTKIFGGGDSGGIKPGGGGSAVPELDMTVAGSAIVLLLGGIALMVSRRREQE